MAEIFHKATTVRGNFSMIMDQAIYEKPQFISRTHDKSILISMDMLSSLLDCFVIPYYIEADKECVVITNDVIEDIIGSGENEETAINDFCEQLFDYARDYYKEFGLFSRSPNRKSHFPYVMRILTMGSPEEIREMIECQAGTI